jgi:hypothetical protein
VRFVLETNSESVEDIVETVIPKQPTKERDKITIRLDRDVLETLEHYCRYQESSRDWSSTGASPSSFEKTSRSLFGLPTIEDDAGGEPPSKAPNRKESRVRLRNTFPSPNEGNG